jgi:hypothetical protein
MKLNTNIAFALSMVVVLMAVIVNAQDAPKPTPQLSIAAKVALSSIEEKKRVLQGQFQDLQTQESQIEAEFSGQNKGYHLNPQTFAVEADPAPVKSTEKPKPAAPAAPEKK